MNVYSGIVEANLARLLIDSDYIQLVADVWEYKISGPPGLSKWIDVCDELMMVAVEVLDEG